MNESDKDKMVQVPQETLVKLQEQMAKQEQAMEDMRAKNAGLEALINNKGADAEGDKKLRQRKNFEPKFRTIRLRKYPIAGDFENLGYVIGWTNRGAYQEVDRSGVSPAIVDYIDIFFLGQERTKEGKLKAEKVKLLDLFNKGIQVHCKIIETKKEEKMVPTGEEIDISVFDPQHGLISTGEKIDGYFTYSDTKYIVQIPGVDKPVIIDSEFVN